MTQTSLMPAFRHRAFISYSPQDKSWASWLRKAWEVYRGPRRLVGMTTAVGEVPARLVPIFHDRDELPSATDLNATVQLALECSDCLIAICSPRAARSRQVNAEIAAFERLDRANRILCMIVGTAPATAADEHEFEQCFPPALGYRAGEGSEAADRRSEPIGAGARPGAGGRTNAKLKLIAGMLGVGFDALAQREQQRRYRRLLLVAAALLALALMSVFTLVAITARHEAERQRAHAEGLVEFMLGDQTKKLQRSGRLSQIRPEDHQPMKSTLAKIWRLLPCHQR
jgi:hypothetical protein